MKKIFLIFVLAGVLSCYGCAGSSGQTETPKEEQEQDGNEAAPVEGEAGQDKGESDQEGSSGGETAGEEPKEKEPAQGKQIEVYYINEEEQLVSRTAEVEEVTAETVWAELIKDGTVAADSKALSLSKDEEQRITLDVNEAFGQQLRSYGTTGERELLNCVVNTFLDDFEGSAIRITEEGGTLMSGHAEYAEYMEKVNE